MLEISQKARNRTLAEGEEGTMLLDMMPTLLRRSLVRLEHIVRGKADLRSDTRAPNLHWDSARQA